MIARRMDGVIINISTAPAYVREGAPHYVASKQGVVALTRRMAAELGEHGIRVLALAPTVILTPGMEESAAQGGWTLDDLAEQMSRELPLGRASLPDDVARVALFCAFRPRKLHDRMRRPCRRWRQARRSDVRAVRFQVGER